jgi:hypothetical protein
MEVGSLESQPNSKKYDEKYANEAYQLNQYPMVTASPNFKCGLFEGHISIIFTSPSTPLIQPTSPLK